MPTRSLTISPLISSLRSASMTVLFDFIPVNCIIRAVDVSTWPLPILCPFSHCSLVLAVSNSVIQTWSTIGSVKCCHSSICRCVFIHPLSIIIQFAGKGGFEPPNVDTYPDYPICPLSLPRCRLRPSQVAGGYRHEASYGSVFSCSACSAIAFSFLTCFLVSLIALASRLSVGSGFTASRMRGRLLTSTVTV